jgi:hypothetical protein
MLNLFVILDGRFFWFSASKIPDLEEKFFQPAGLAFFFLGGGAANPGFNNLC